VGELVQQGQVIGLVGETGRATGAHLHWELWVNGIQVDPLDWLTQVFP
jgi:murein DD-endopeptidase MepM/ murein hydrolase activator NlpD